MWLMLRMRGTWWPISICRRGHRARRLGLQQPASSVRLVRIGACVPVLCRQAQLPARACGARPHLGQQVEQAALVHREVDAARHAPHLHRAKQPAALVRAKLLLHLLDVLRRRGAAVAASAAAAASALTLEQHTAALPAGRLPSACPGPCRSQARRAPSAAPAQRLGRTFDAADRSMLMSISEPVSIRWCDWGV
jgi:hypothetical protein